MVSHSEILLIHWKTIHLFLSKIPSYYILQFRDRPVVKLNIWVKYEVTDDRQRDRCKMVHSCLGDPPNIEVVVRAKKPQNFQSLGFIRHYLWCHNGLLFILQIFLENRCIRNFRDWNGFRSRNLLSYLEVRPTKRDSKGISHFWMRPTNQITWTVFRDWK